MIDAAEAAGRAILEVRASASLEVRQKVDGPVTAADLASNALLEPRLRILVADAGWLSEETADSTARLSQTRVWVVDPLDGTQEFIQGTADFGVSIALVEAGRPLLGVLHFPVSGETLWARHGAGAFERSGGQERPLNVDPSPRPQRLSVRWADLRKPWMEPFKEALGIVRLKPVGSTIRKLAAVARGETQAYVTPTFRPFQWDVCAGDLIIEEAGGLVTDLEGEVCRYNGAEASAMHGMVASSSAVHATLLAELQQVAKRLE